jgi:ankyrin repeat protein
MSRIFKIAALLFLLTYADGCLIAARNIEARLRLAACEGRVDNVKTLVKMTAKVNARHPNGGTALIGAESCGQKEESATEIVRILIDNGADVNLQDRRGATVLMYAASNGHSRVIRQLLAKGAAFNVKDNNGDTALIYAVRNGCSVEALKMLIEAGADLNAHNNKGHSVLDEAKASKACPYSGMSQVLIDSGVK